MTFPHQDCSKTMTSFFHQFGTKAQKLGKVSKLGSTKTQPRSIPFVTKLLTTHFDAFLLIPHQGCSKTTTSLYHQFCYQCTKTKPSDQTWLSENQTKINSFCNQSFDTSFWMHLWDFPTKIAQKPWLHCFTNLATKAQKANAPNLAKPKSNQDQFLLQPNFSYLILHTFVTIPHQDCSQTMTSLFHQFCYQGTKSQSTQIG